MGVLLLGAGPRRPPCPPARGRPSLAGEPSLERVDRDRARRRARPRPTPEVAFRVALAGADARTRLAILLAGVCGLRRGELARVRRADLEADLVGWSLRVRGKGGHVRMVPVPDELAALIRRRPEGWLFPSSHGGHLTPHHLGKLISRHLPEGMTTHTLRHRCGTVAYATTGDLLAVQTLLGHAKPETTAIYVGVPMDSVRRAMTGALGWSGANGRAVPTDAPARPLGSEAPAVSPAAT